MTFEMMFLMNVWLVNMVVMLISKRMSSSTRKSFRGTRMKWKPNHGNHDFQSDNRFFLVVVVSIHEQSRKNWNILSIPYRGSEYCQLLKLYNTASKWYYSSLQGQRTETNDQPII